MPLHDWSRVDPNDFHFSWIASLKNALNNGLLPTGYYAMAEHTTPPVIPDVVTLSIPDGSSSPMPFPVDGPGRTATRHSTITATAPGKKLKTAGRWGIAIWHARNRQIVAVIEIVSPSNKAKKLAFADLVGKTVNCFVRGFMSY